MSEDIIRYDILVQNALRSVIHKALTEVQKTGLPGNHHFFITFATNAPGVRVSNRIREQYADQMTIVLQHQYWDLEVNETGFSVGLSFSDVPETLHVPYAAVRGFYDPSVNFELEFDVEMADDEDEAGDKPTSVLHAVSDDDNDNVAQDTGKTPSRPGLPAPDGEDDAAVASDGDGADVVSLDSFRKKK